GDFNGDGKLDVATANRSIYGEVSILLGNGDGTFQAPTSVALGSTPLAVAVGDFNADSKLDLVVLSYTNDGFGNVDGYASVLLGNGGGSFSGPHTTWLGAGDFASAAVADFNGDGKPDFATTNYGSATVTVLLGDG